jgi:hypothetical protein
MRRLLADRIKLSGYAEKLFGAFTLSTLLFPTTFLNKFLFLILCTWMIFIFVYGVFPRKLLMLPSFGLSGIFLYGYGISLLGSNDHSLAFQFFFASIIPLLIHFVIYYQLKLDKIVDFSGRIMLVVTSLYFFLVFNPDVPYALDIAQWYEIVSQSTTAERDYLGDGLVFTLALSTAPFLFVSFGLVLVRILKVFSWLDLILIIFYISAFLLSGARGIVVIAILLFIFLLFFNISSIFFRIVVSVLILLVIFLLLQFIISDTMIFDSDEFSNMVKIGHFTSFLDQLTWFKFLFGDGLGAYYFSSGVLSWKAHTELTPIDLIRYVGFPFALFVYLILIFPRLSSNVFRSRNREFFLIFMLFLLLSITNPVLFNSMGMIVVIWYWSKLLSVPVCLRKSVSRDSV